jgi:hypothetical protein
MSKVLKGLLLAGGLAVSLTGCQTQQQMLDEGQPKAMDTALRRGRFDLSCPGASAVLLSDDFIQPAVQGPWVMGISRMEYTVGIEGCGQRKTLVVMCQEGSDTCFAADPRGENQSQP